MLVKFDPNFSFLKDEEDLIEEIARNAQQIFLKEKFEFLSSGGEISLNNNKNIVSLELKNSLRDLVAKLCTKYFGNKTFYGRWHDIKLDYEKVLFSAFTNATIKKDKQLLIHFNDAPNDHWNTLVKITEFIPFEQIASEVEDLMKRWLSHVITTHKKYGLFGEDYVQWREEEVKFSKLKKKLPEFEGIL